MPIPVLMPVLYPYCRSDHVNKRDKTDTPKQRYRRHNLGCAHQSFLLDPAYRGRLPAMKILVIEMSLNGSGVRNTALVLKISANTVLAYVEPLRCGSYDRSGRRGRGRRNVKLCGKEKGPKGAVACHRSP